VFLNSKEISKFKNLGNSDFSLKKETFQLYFIKRTKLQRILEINEEISPYILGEEVFEPMKFQKKEIQHFEMKSMDFINKNPELIPTNFFRRLFAEEFTKLICPIGNLLEKYQFNNETHLIHVSGELMNVLVSNNLENTKESPLKFKLPTSIHQIIVNSFESKVFIATRHMFDVNILQCVGGKLKLIESIHFNSVVFHIAFLSSSLDCKLSIILEDKKVLVLDSKFKKEFEFELLDIHDSLKSDFLSINEMVFNSEKSINLKDLRFPNFNPLVHLKEPTQSVKKYPSKPFEIVSLDSCISFYDIRMTHSPLLKFNNEVKDEPLKNIIFEKINNDGKTTEINSRIIIFL
jgi:hypothetical protein